MDNEAVNKSVVDKGTVEWIVLTKAPVPGLVKTRLIPALGEQGACDLYEQLLVRLQDTLTSLTSTQPLQVALWIAGDAEHEVFKSWSSLATFYQQPEGSDSKVDLGERMAVAVKSSLSRGCIPVLIGVDVPDLDEAYLTDCMAQLAVRDLVISPAEDGGYGLLGMKQFYSELFVNKSWGSDTVFESTQADIARLKINAAYLQKVWDVDELADAERFYQFNL